MSRKLSIYPKVVYTLQCPITFSVVYVGCSQDIYKRFAAHLNSPSAELRPWIQSLKERMLCPIISEIDRPTEGQNAYDLEAYWVQQFQAWGFKLFNMALTNNDAPLAVRLKRKQKKRLMVPKQDLLFWKSIKRTGDVMRISELSGHGFSSVNVVFTTGGGRPDVIKGISEYYESVRETRVKKSA